jgi:hypothetical protein
VESLLEDHNDKASIAINVPKRSSSTTMKVLEMIQRRLKAELRSQGNGDLKLLALLLSCRDPSQRLDMLESKLDRVEAIESFTIFLQDGIDYIAAHGLQARENPNKEQAVKVELSAATFEMMKDILCDVKELSSRLQTGSKDGIAFEVQSDS